MYVWWSLIKTKSDKEICYIDVDHYFKWPFMGHYFLIIWIQRNVHTVSYIQIFSNLLLQWKWIFSVKSLMITTAFVIGTIASNTAWYFSFYSISILFLLPMIKVLCSSSYLLSLYTCSVHVSLDCFSNFFSRFFSIDWPHTVMCLRDNKSYDVCADSIGMWQVVVPATSFFLYFFTCFCFFIL